MSRTTSSSTAVRALKLVVVGGGSTCTPELVDGFARLHDTLPIGELVLVDPAGDRLALLAERGGAYYSEAAVNLVASLLGTGSAAGDVQVVNVRNGGTLPFLPEDAVIEVPAQVGADGAKPLPVPPVEPLYAGLIAHVTGYEQLALEAALHGGRQRVFQALLAHPLVGQTDLAEQLTDRLLAHNREHLAWA